MFLLLHSELDFEDLFDVLDPAPPPLILRHVESTVNESFLLFLDCNHLLLN